MSVISQAYTALNLLIRRSQGITVEELAQEMGLGWRQAYRYLQELSIQFPVERKDDKRFRLMRRNQWTA
jgi:DNA-binding IclR family transcriptional regulator